MPDSVMEREVRELMTPGCVAISDAASVDQAAEALAANRVRAVLVVGAVKGTPLGWVTARGLLDWQGRDGSAVSAREAITEGVTGIHPSASVRAAICALSMPGVSRLVVRRRGDRLPEGVVTDFDLVVQARRSTERP